VSLSVDDLIAYFRAGAKPRAQFRIGIEQEKLGTRLDGAPVGYGGPNGIEDVLLRLEQRGYTATRDHGHVTGLELAGERVTIEPGGQLEFSGVARETASACRDALVNHVRDVIDTARPLGIRFLRLGARPFGKPEDIDWLPKVRYDVMRAYFPRYGRSSRLAHHMMKMTATVQANFDYESESDAVDKIRTAYGVSSIVTAMYAGSPFADGADGRQELPRSDLAGDGRGSLRPAAVRVRAELLLPRLRRVGAGRADVLRRARRRLPARERDAVPALHRRGIRGRAATIRDWEIHLSTLFPEVRLKRYIELRGADAGPVPMATALGALWRGLLDDRDARTAAWELVAKPSFAERQALRHEVPRAALAATFGGRPLRELALELIRISDAGLARLSGGEEDRPLLAPLWAYAASGRTPADELLEEFEAAVRRSGEAGREVGAGPVAGRRRERETGDGKRETGQCQIRHFPFPVSRSRFF
jgi:glutamate--cysteine ligase